MADAFLPRVNSQGKRLSNSLVLGWDSVHQLTSNVVVFISVFLGTGGTWAVTKLFWLWCQRNRVRRSGAEKNAEESHLQ